MNYEEAKKLEYGDRVKINYPGLYGKTNVYFGSFVRLTRRGYIHYTRPHSPPGQKAHMKYVEPIEEKK